MVSLKCLSSSQRSTDPPRSSNNISATKIAALSFHRTGLYAAYAVQRTPILPREGDEDPSHCVFIARTADTETKDTTVSSATSFSESPSPSVSSPVANNLLPFSEWPLVQTLCGVHAAPVTALAWCESTNALATASSDRCVYVWIPNEPVRDSETSAPLLSRRFCFSFHAVPQLVMLSTEVVRSPTAVAWSAQGSKLYLGTAGGSVAVGRYDATQRWWICRMLRSAHTSSSPGPSSAQENVEGTLTTGTAQGGEPHHLCTCGPRDHLITALAPHPHDNTQLALGLLNGTVQILSTHIKSVDGAIDKTHELASTEEDTGTGGAPFGHVHFACRIPCWLHAVAWSPSASQLAVVGHDSALHVWQLTSRSTSCRADTPQEVNSEKEKERDVGAAPQRTLRLRTLPLTQCTFASESVLLGAGFDGLIYVFTTCDAGQDREKWCLVFKTDNVPSAISSSSRVNPLKETAAQLSLKPTQPHDMERLKSDGSAGETSGTSAIDDTPADEAATLVTSAKTARQRAFEFFEKSSSGLSAKSENAALPQINSRPQEHHGFPISKSRSSLSVAPIHLLAPLPVSGTSENAAAVEDSTRAQFSSFLSVNSRGLVQVWRLCSGTAA